MAQRGHCRVGWGPRNSSQRPGGACSLAAGQPPTPPPHLRGQGPGASPRAHRSRGGGRVVRTLPACALRGSVHPPGTSWVPLASRTQARKTTLYQTIADQRVVTN